MSPSYGKWAVDGSGIPPNMADGAHRGTTGSGNSNIFIHSCACTENRYES